MRGFFSNNDTKKIEKKQKTFVDITIIIIFAVLSLTT